MFGYIKKKKVLDIINTGQRQLYDKQNQIILENNPENKEIDSQDLLISINRLEGGIYFLERLKKHFI